ncbi:CHAT domain-containing protein [Nitrosococcus oceani]|uniref:CHAT domain-containing protein n=2 Tax=Nitrosococcus oceani TaxID=1229 RepID=Q3JE40_NITOC|nr:CHAT domain-containing protein [Nitrosococcus oceani]KFI20689.1 hypothetical protein IB75_01935 [Nitrosococcus oceani C-27]ABA56906.1 conserved hypothetical protein [Nitrosococcus oceani ATCC 19707]EDZ66022.1 hypothetical protein NOC27_2702 [Nitrosococcus oceani AFC27]KFI23781.1 hypothetical protein HW44_02070 [Nitrosococcus oceani]GEM21489.1 CHAT domain-containing protein [Nitrosococcus oceani]
MESVTEERLWEEWLLRTDEPSGEIIGGWFAGVVDPEVWRHGYAMQHLLRRVGKELLAPVAEHLGEAKRLLLVTHGGLHLLPLEAAPFPAGNGAMTTLSERMAVSVTPSAVFLAENRQHARGSEQSWRLVALENPRNDPQLPYTSLEVARIAHYAGAERTTRLRGKEATLPALAENLAGATFNHFSCHGRYHWGSPLLSALELHPAEGEPTVEGGEPGHLTLLHLYQGKVDFTGARLVTLSACQTGITEVREQAEEAVGLPGGLLGAGVPTVVASLWSVADLSTAFLMSRFYYHLLCQAHPPDRALQQAQADTRTATWKQIREELEEQAVLNASDKLGDEGELDQRPFAQPYHWAAFQVWGDGWTPIIQEDA